MDMRMSEHPQRRDWLRVCGRAMAWMLAMGSFTATAPGQSEPTPPPPPQPEQPAAETEDSDLGRRLVRKAVTSSDEDIMQEIMRLMGESSQRLDVRFDAGSETQIVQKQALDKLDEAIKQAAAQLRQKKTQPRERQQDKRKQQDASKTKPEESESKPGPTSSDPDAATADNKGEAEESKLPGGDLRDARRSWGLLPLRDRDEVIQGKNEESLERYRQLIDRYFRMLQGAEEEDR
jgi:hypothetical protein